MCGRNTRVASRSSNIDSEIQVALFCNTRSGKDTTVSLGESSSLIDDKGESIFAVYFEHGLSKFCSTLQSVRNVYRPMRLVVR